MRLLSAVLVGFLVVAGLLWLPFETMSPLHATNWADPTPAGEIRKGFVLEQRVFAPVEGVDRLEDGYCFGIRFATYQRRNRGRVVVQWSQQEQTQEWRIRARSLVDNQFRYFCPRHATRLTTPFNIRISGRDGPTGRSPTLWLVADTSLGEARLNGQAADAGISLEIVERRRTGVAAVLGAANGAFLMAWLCTLVIGLAVLLYAFRFARPSRQRPE